MDNYTISLEISGPTAMWTRPDTGDTPVSYPAPTFGAAKAIFECILLSDWAEVVPTKVEICKPIVYHSYVTNYGGPLRKSRVVKAGASYQLMATVLVNVCYRLYATLAPVADGYDKRGKEEQKRQRTGTTNGPHAYKDRFERRLKNGQSYSIPCLGWKEFSPDYVGAFRPETEVCEESLLIPSMLRTCFPSGRRSKWEPRYVQNVEIVSGVMSYVE